MCIYKLFLIVCRLYYFTDFSKKKNNAIFYHFLREFYVPNHKTTIHNKTHFSKNIVCYEKIH